VKTPSAAHPITIAPHPGRVVVRFAGAVVADTVAALDLTEASMRPVLYVPRADADMTAFEPTARSTHCPFKGDASYFTLSANGAQGDNAVWSYETPYPAVAPIAGHLAFYPDKVTIEAS
jgi:uncharacterized protein (DUF427 family)